MGIGIHHEALTIVHRVACRGCLWKLGGWQRYVQRGWRHADDGRTIDGSYLECHRSGNDGGHDHGECHDERSGHDD